MEQFAEQRQQILTIQLLLLVCKITHNVQDFAAKLQGSCRKPQALLSILGMFPMLWISDCPTLHQDWHQTPSRQPRSKWHLYPSFLVASILDLFLPFHPQRLLPKSRHSTNTWRQVAPNSSGSKHVPRKDDNIQKLELSLVCAPSMARTGMYRANSCQPTSWWLNMDKCK